MALCVLTNHAYNDQLIPVSGFLVLMAILTILMVSRIRYPEFGTVLRQRWLSLTTLGAAAVLAVWLPPQLIWLGLQGGYISFGLARAAYRLVR